MKNLVRVSVLTCFLIFFVSSSFAQIRSKTIHGAGASYPYPVYAQWTFKYYHLTHTKINYQSIGSGGGIAQVKANTIDFGASDAPLSKKELDEAGLIQFPMIMGAVVPIVHIEGVKSGQLKLTPDVLADIYLGKIQSWNDLRIQQINPDLGLPAKSITVIYRADGSGSTWIFTNYLTEVSKAWEEKAGKGESVRWPAGIGAKGNEGVSVTVQRIPGAIGYVQYAYAYQNNLAFVQLRNKSGYFISPSMQSFRAAAQKAVWDDSTDFYLKLTNQKGLDVWPVFGVSYILMHKKQNDTEKAGTIIQFFDWCYHFGDRDAEKLYYIPIPQNTVDMIHAYWKREILTDHEIVWYYHSNESNP